MDARGVSIPAIVPGVAQPLRGAVLQYATPRIGAILVNINPAYKATELEYALNKRRQPAVFGRGLPAADYSRSWQKCDRCSQPATS